ncbi:MAG: hypothetical protein M3083_10355 [Actinomycetota bacterium]|nr:hypothetical protein [Actinomycetota bacterium]
MNGKQQCLSFLAALVACVLVGSSNSFACTILVGSARLTQGSGGVTMLVSGLPLGGACPTGRIEDSPVACGYNQLLEGEYQLDFVQKPVFDPTTLPWHHECMPDSPNVQIGTMTIQGGKGAAAVILPHDATPGDRSSVCVASPYDVTGTEYLIVIV